MAKVKISELPSLTPATLDTTYVVGISGSTTYKISINQLTSSLDTTFATDLVTAALSSSLDGKLSTSSYSTDSASFNSRIISGSVVAGTISSSAQITAFGFLSTSTDLSSLNTISASYLSFTQSYYSASSSFDSRVDSLENATSSYLTSLNGAISGAGQISDLGFVTGSYTTINSFNSLTQSFNSISQSFTTISGSVGGIDFSTLATTGSFNTFTQSYYSASASFDSRVDGLENATSSYLTSLNGAISSSAQITAFGFVSGAYVSSSTYTTDSASFNSRIISGSSVALNQFETLQVSGSLSVTGSTTLRGAVNVGTGSGFEGGEINLAYAQTTSLTGSVLNFDVYQDRLRIFEGGGNSRGAYLNVASQSTGVGSEILTTTSTKILATPAWTSAGAITLTATTTNPTKGVTAQDNISYRQLGAKEWEIVMTYNQSANTGYVQGSGDYLITLPNGLSFDTTLPSQTIYTSNVGTNTWAHNAFIIPNGNGLITNTTVGGHIYPMVYSATKFRILSVTYGSGIMCWGSGFYSTIDIPKIQLSFRFTST